MNSFGGSIFAWRRALAGGAALAALLGGPAGAAHADEFDPQSKEWDRAHESPQWFSAEIGCGDILPSGDAVQMVYGKNPHAISFHARAGVLIKSILDIGVSGDATQVTGHRIGTVSGTESAELTRLSFVPLAGTALIRLDFLHNQPIVPYGGGGVAYGIWGERNPIADTDITGDKYGWTAVGGVMFLLDVLEPGRAKDLDTWWGVNHTYLQLQVSRTRYDRLGKGATGLDLGHDEGSAAILLEF